MKEKFNIGNLDFNELKSKINEIKEASEKAKDEYKKKELNGEVPKQALGNKILGIIVLILLVVGIGFIFISNLDTLLLPKNSITIAVTDEKGEAINGLKLEVRGETIYYEEFTDISDVTILGAIPGNYTLSFEEVPVGYSCPTLVDNFTLQQDGKVKVEYQCTKESN